MHNISVQLGTDFVAGQKVVIVNLQGVGACTPSERGVLGSSPVKSGAVRPAIRQVKGMCIVALTGVGLSRLQTKNRSLTEAGV